MTKQRTFWPGAALALVAVVGAAAPGRAQQPSKPKVAADTALPTAAADTALPPSVGAEDRRTVTLEEAVRLAMQASPAITQSEGQMRQASAAERTAYGNFLPSLSLSTTAAVNSTQRYNPTTNTSVSGSSDSYTTGFSGSWDIFTGRRFAQLKQAKAGEQSAQAGLVTQQFAVALSAKTTFFNVLRADELIRVAQSQLATAQEGLDAANQRLKVGSATRSDVLRARLSVTQAKQALAQAENQRRTGAYALGRTVGVDGAVGARLETPLEPTPLAYTPEQLAQMIEAEAPSVRAAAAAARASGAGVTVARAQYIPSLRLSTGYDWYNDTPAFSSAQASWNVRFGLSYPLFNGFQREQTVEQANVAADVANAQLADARRAAHSELESALGALRLAEQQLELNQEAVQVAAEDLRVQQERYRLGASTILDQITSQSALVQAQTNLVNARYDYQIARAQLDALVGKDL